MQRRRPHALHLEHIDSKLLQVPHDAHRILLHANGVLVLPLRVVHVMKIIQRPGPLHRAGPEGPGARLGVLREHEVVRRAAGIEDGAHVLEALHIIYCSGGEALEVRWRPAVIYNFIPLVAQNTARRVVRGTGAHRRVAPGAVLSEPCTVHEQRVHALRVRDEQVAGQGVLGPRALRGATVAERPGPGVVAVQLAHVLRLLVADHGPAF